MAFLDHNGESKFPIPKDKVFEAVRCAIPTIKGMKIHHLDKLAGRINVKAGISLRVLGENIPVQLIQLSENKTRVQIAFSQRQPSYLAEKCLIGEHGKEQKKHRNNSFDNFRKFI